MVKRYRSLIVNKCEIEGCEEIENLHLHHIVERTEQNTSNHVFNIGILCPNHHNYVHSGRIRIIGVFPSTKLPNKRTLVYELDGKKNIEIENSYISFTPQKFKI